MTHLACISGSLRRQSYNSALIRALPALAPEGMTFETLSFADVPVYNGDLEPDGLPASVERLRTAIHAADGLIISTPEYNHGIPGGLKNMIDWLSRPPSPHGLFGVPTAILGASDGTIGTARSQYALRQTLTALNAPTMPFPQVLVALAHKKIDASGTVTDESTLQFMKGWLVDVQRWMDRFPRSERA